MKFHNRLYSNIRVNENFFYHLRLKSLSLGIFENIIHIDESDTHECSDYAFDFSEQNLENDFQTVLSEMIDDNIMTSSLCVDINFH